MSGLGNPDDDVMATIVLVENHVALVRSMIPAGESATHCADCATQIPEARRIAQKGCRFCVECQVPHDKLPQIRTVTKML